VTVECNNSYKVVLSGFGMGAEPEDLDPDSKPRYVCFYRIYAGLMKSGEGLRSQNGDPEPKDVCAGCKGQRDNCFHPLSPKHRVRNYAAVDRFPNGRPRFDCDYDD